jgi:hypothetical protein
LRRSVGRCRFKGSRRRSRRRGLACRHQTIGRSGALEDQRAVRAAEPERVL